MSEETTVEYNGIGFCGALALIFIVLKLIGVIDWSWWWVLAPIWIPVVIIFGVIGTFFLVVFIVFIKEKYS